MLSYYAKRSSGEEFEKLTMPLAEGVWVYGDGVVPREFNELIERYDLDRNIVRDIHDENELPRVEFSDGKQYIFLRTPQKTKKGGVITSPLLAIIDNSNYFTLSTHDSLLPKELIASSVPLHGTTSLALLLGTVAALISRYEELIQHTSRAIKDTGRRLRTHEVTNKDFIHFVTVEDNLNEYEMNLNGILAVTHRLRENNHDMLGDNDIEALEDISLHIQQLLVAISTYAHSVESIRNAYGTIANNTLNERMKTLTVFTVLITLPNVFYGMLGMNFRIPYQDVSWAFPVVVTFTAVLIITVFILAKRFKVF